MVCQRLLARRKRAMRASRILHHQVCGTDFYTSFSFYAYFLVFSNEYKPSYCEFRAAYQLIGTGLRWWQCWR